MSEWRNYGIAHWDADCAKCCGELAARMIAEGTLTWAESLSMPMFVCPNCGNKRCPKASWHVQACAVGGDV